MQWEFDKYKFYNEGYNVSLLPQPLVDECNRIIQETKWIGDKPAFADWSLIPDIESGDELFYEELVRGRLSYGNAPTSIKNLANAIIDMDFFLPFKQGLVKKQHCRYKGFRNIMPVSMGLWDKQLDVNWHNDISDTSDFFILIYINPYEEWKDEWGGHLKIGKEKDDGSVEVMYYHRPVDSTFVVLNNTNTMFNHSVVTAGDRTRYTFGFRYKIY